MRLATWKIVGLSALAALAIGIAALTLQGGWSADGAGAGTRLTARWSFLWFIAAWSASSLAVLWPGGWRTALLRRRRAVGLAFAANHGVHLGFILLAATVFGHENARLQIIGGGFAYVMIALMAATSNDASVRLLGPKAWRGLHATGGWIILLIFTRSYVGRLAEKPWLAVPAVTLIALALLLRLAAFSKARQRPRTA